MTTPVSTTSPSTEAAYSGRFSPGTKGFTITLALSMAMTALAIDAILPAFGDIREHFGYASTSTAVAPLVTAFIAGLGVGQLPAGLLADHFGRRPVMWGGIAVYVVGAVLVVLAPSLPLMIGARFVWGLGGAGPRVAAVAMVRDAYSGERMAKEMSIIMAVFLVVPMIAPAIGSALISLGSWKLTVGFCVLVALVLLALSSQLSATLPVSQRHAISVRAVVTDWKAVLVAPGVVPYLVAMTALMGSFMAYISSSEALFGETYGLERLFPLLFSGVALVLAISVLANGRVIERIGLPTMLKGAAFGLILVALAFAIVVAATNGRPSFVVFYAFLILLAAFQQSLLTNINAAAMVPLGHVAGTGSAVLGLIPLVFGSLIATAVSAQYDGTVRVFGWAYLVAGCIALGGVWSALRSAPLDDKEVSTGIPNVDAPARDDVPKDDA